MINYQIKLDIFCVGIKNDIDQVLYDGLEYRNRMLGQGGLNALYG